MAKFVYLYAGHDEPQTPEAQEQSMKEWMGWFGDLGESVSDMGNQFLASATVGSGGVSAGANPNTSGYTVISADSLEDASAKAAGCPLLRVGGSVEVYQALEM